MRRRTAGVVLGLSAIAAGACASLLNLDQVTYSAQEGGAPSDSAAGDAAADGAGEDGAGEAGPPCAWDAPFGAPVPVVGLEGDIMSARLSPDELRAYVAVGVGRQFLAFTDRVDAGSSFASPPDPAPFVNVVDGGQQDQRFAAVSDDELRLVFYDDGIWTSVRQARATPFAGPTSLVPLNNASDPYLLPGGDIVFFATGDSIQSVSLDGSTAVRFQPAAENAFAPVVTADGLTMYFQSNRDPDGGAPRANDTGIWVVHRNRTVDNFARGDVRYVPELETPTHDAPRWISPDGCRLYLRRDDPGQGIYVARKRR